MSRGPAFALPVTPDDVVRHALAAYYRAVGECTAPIAAPDPAQWSSPDFFVEVLCDFMQLRMRCEAARAGHTVDAEPERLERWLSRPMHRDLHIRDVDPGLWEELQASAAGASMAQGCAAPSPAVGPAPVGAQSRADGHPAEPLFSGPARQELPQGESVVHTQAKQELASHEEATSHNAYYVKRTQVSGRTPTQPHPRRNFAGTA